LTGSTDGTSDRARSRGARRTRWNRSRHVRTGLSVGLAAGCTPLKIGLGIHAPRYDNDPLIGDEVLQAFVATVIPGAPVSDPNLIRVFEDDYYPLARFRGALIADLCQRSDRMFNMKMFSWLNAEQRTQVIQNAISSQSVTRQLYEGAIFLTQISCYAGIYDASGGCELIDFPGKGFIDLADQTYPAAERYLASSLTSSGNYA